MHSDLVEIGWNETQWNRILSTVVDEAHKARVAAQLLPMVGPEDATTVAVPSYALAPEPNPNGGARMRLAVDSDPTLFITTISVNVSLRTREAADPELSAALTMFRRAANYIARIEDALIFNGRRGPNVPPPHGLAGIPDVYQVHGHGAPEGIFSPENEGARQVVALGPAPGGTALGEQVIYAMIEAINMLDGSGQLGPYACALSPLLFQAICTPNASLVLPRDRILPFLQGPLLRSSAISGAPPAPVGNAQRGCGAVIALSGNPVELLVATDINVRYLQTSEEPRLVFRVAERVALRIKESAAIATFML